MADNIGLAPKRSRSAANLPDEIVNEILLLLPARSVLRFRAVCRLWAAHLSSPAFTEAYAAKGEARRTSKIVVFAASPGRRSTTAYSCSIQGSPAADPLFAVDHLRTDFLSLSSWPSRGLMLFSDTRTAAGRHHWVCNPSTGECRALPQQRHRSFIASSAGLVLDDRTKEHKVVHVFLNTPIGFGCEVYTLGDTGRRWRPLSAAGLGSLKANARNITRALQSEEAVTKMPPVAADGFLHWLIYPATARGQGREEDILRFSAADESFDFISAPPVDMGENDVWLDEHFPAVPFHLVELQGSLGMVHDLRRHGGHGGSSIDVWVLRGRNGGAGREWSLDYCIAVTPLLARDVHSPRFITILGAGGGISSSSGKKEAKTLLLATSEHKVFSYTPDSGGVETVFSPEEAAIGLHKEAAAGLWIGMYEDSLVKIGGESPREKEVSSAIREILLRLPLKSIAQSMLVCKEWCALIENESFVAAHMSMERPTSILMATNGRARRAFFAFAPLESWLDQASSALAGSLVEGKIICSKPCHGLNLISTGNDDYLCNPRTGAIQCLGVRGRSRFGPWRRGSRQPCRHAFSVGRNIGLGFDRSTGEHVAVEIGQIGGALACVLKTSESDAWTCAGAPPMPVMDLPPAHVDGTLYWVGEQAQATAAPCWRVSIVAFDISTRAFGVLACEQHAKSDHDVFLVELNGRLSLVVVDRDAEEIEIRTMRERGAWFDARIRIRLRGQQDFSPRTTTVVVPLEVSREDGRILLNTVRALGYYDIKTGAIDTVYSLDHLQFPPSNLAFPILCQESLVRVVQDEEDVPAVASPPVSGHNNGRRRTSCCVHPEHASADSESGTPRPIFQRCQYAGGCQGSGEIYSTCCKRVVWRVCIRRCPEHSYQRDHVPLNNLYSGVIEGIQRHGLPMEHPFVPDPDYYCYYYSAKDAGDVMRHVFVSIKDLKQGKEACHLTECAYRMDGNGAVRETWVRRYLKIDSGRGPLT